MSSSIDVSKPADGVSAVKADLRSNWEAAKDEIEELQSTRTLSELKALDPATLTYQTAFLSESGRGGIFIFDPGDLSSQVAIDPAEAVYIAPNSDATGGSGAWVRRDEGPLRASWFGVVGDGIANDMAKLSDAFTLAAELGRKLVIGKPSGFYNLEAYTNEGITLKNPRLDVDFEGAHFVSNGLTGQAFTFRPEAGSTGALTSSAVRGDYTIFVSSTTGIQERDIIHIKSDAVFETGYNYLKHETHRVLSFTSTTITLSEPLTFSYTLPGETVSVDSYRPYGCSFSGDGILEHGTTFPTFFSFQFNDKLLFENFQLIDPQREGPGVDLGGGDPIRVKSCFGATIRGIFAYGVRYAINITDGSRNTRVDNIVGEHCRSPLDFNTGCDTGWVTHIRGYNNDATLGGHPCFNVNYRDIECIEGKAYSHRCVGGSIKGFKFKTSFSGGSYGALLQFVTLVDDVFDEYEVTYEDWVIEAPSISYIRANSSQKSITINNVRVAQLLFPVAGNYSAFVSNSKFQSANWSGGTLFLSNIELVFDFPDLQVSDREDIAISLSQGSNVNITGLSVVGGHAYLFGDTNSVDQVNLNNFTIKDIDTDLFDGIGSGQASSYYHFSNGLFADCVLPLTNFDDENILVDNVRYAGGTGAVLSGNRGSIAGTTDGSGNISIAHGLYITPTWAQVAAVGDVTYQASVQSIDATNIVVRAANMSDGSDLASTAITVHWEARVTA